MPNSCLIYDIEQSSIFPKLRASSKYVKVRTKLKNSLDSQKTLQLHTRLIFTPQLARPCSNCNPKRYLVMVLVILARGLAPWTHFRTRVLTFPMRSSCCIQLPIAGFKSQDLCAKWYKPWNFWSWQNNYHDPKILPWEPGTLKQIPKQFSPMHQQP